MFSFVGRLVVALLLVAEVSYAEFSVRDNRDGRIYRSMPSGSLNWFTDNLSYQKKVALRDDAKNAYYRHADWSVSCPVGTHVPDIQEWTLFSKDRFTGPRKLSNVKSFAGKTRGFYDLADPARKVQGKDAAYFAVNDPDGVRAMMLDVKRGNAKMVNLPPEAVVTVRCVTERDLYAEKYVNRKDMKLTDPRDNQVYKVEQREDKLWMVTNLRYSLSSAKQCLLEDSTFCKKFGRFYTYTEAKKACPEATTGLLLRL